jgi:hypothetical protein
LNAEVVDLDIKSCASIDAEAGALPSLKKKTEVSCGCKSRYLAKPNLCLIYKCNHQPPSDQHQKSYFAKERVISTLAFALLVAKKQNT